MEREHKYYDAESIGNVVRYYEATYGISSAELLEVHRAGGHVDGLSNFDRHAWLSFARECEELAPGDATDAFRRGLVTA